MPEGHALRLPADKAANFIRNEADVYAFQADKYLPQRTTVIAPKTQTAVKKRTTARRKSRARRRRR